MNGIKISETEPELVLVVPLKGSILPASLHLVLKNKYNNKISFQEINCTNNNPKVDYVVSFPTIALYNNNNFIDIYKDDRNKIEEYIKKIL